MKGTKVKFEPAFIEEAVFLNMKEKSGHADEPLTVSFHREREKIYSGNLIDQERDEAFQNLCEAYFAKIGLMAIFESIFSEFPLINRPDILIFVKKVWRKKEEEAELYARGNLKTVAIGVQATNSLNRSSLEAFLRHEMMHISDMLDPEFSYSPNPSLGGVNEMEDHLIRDRFRLLWDLYIDTRLRQRGLPTIISQEKQKVEFEKVFLFLEPERRNIIYQKITNENQLNQSDLIEFALDKRFIKTFDQGGLICPLCHFPSYDQIKGWSQETLWVAAEIKENHPDWQPSLGVCLQCFEMYQSRLGIAK